MGDMGYNIVNTLKEQVGGDGVEFTRFRAALQTNFFDMILTDRPKASQRRPTVNFVSERVLSCSAVELITDRFNFAIKEF